MISVNNLFSLRSEGVLKGEVGALDGWLVRIVRFNWFRYGINNPTTLFSSFFNALNMKCIVDDRK